jgi:plasmid stabilization system protein ParE
MPPMPIEFDPRAIAEARATRRWYARRSARVADRFLAELDRAIGQIRATPEQWPSYLHGTRVYRLRRFPYLVIYRETQAAIQVIAVAHGARKPGYWKRRSP